MECKAEFAPIALSNGKAGRCCDPARVYNMSWYCVRRVQCGYSGVYVCEVGACSVFICLRAQTNDASSIGRGNANSDLVTAATTPVNGDWCEGIASFRMVDLRLARRKDRD